jgi:hypothetical protein
LLNLFAGIAVAVSIAVIIIGIILRTRGDPRANNVMLYGFVGLLVALLGWPLVRWVFSGYTISALLGVPANVWSVVVYALSAIMVVVSAVYIALGRVEEGAWSFVAAIAVVGLLGVGLTLFTQAAPAGTLRIEVVGNTVISSSQDLVLVVRAPDAVKPVAINVSWGDGALKKPDPGLHTEGVRKGCKPQEGGGNSEGPAADGQGRRANHRQWKMQDMRGIHRRPICCGSACAV